MLNQAYRYNRRSPKQNLQLERLSPKARRVRIWSVLCIAMFWAGVLIWRLFSLQISGFETWQDWALKQHFKEMKLASERGLVVDRSGKTLAISVPAGSIYVRPKQIKPEQRKQIAKTLANTLQIKVAKVDKALESTQPFVWIERQVPRATSDKVLQLKLPGVDSILEARRVYPYNNAASSLIGKVGVDGVGLSGIEATYEKHLKGDSYKTKMVRDALGNLIDLPQDESDQFEPPRGKPLQLTLDADLQVIVDEELESGRVAANAKTAMAVMVDSVTGELIAMSQAPSINFNLGETTSPSNLRNKLVETVFEPGSILKPIVAAAALDSKAATASEMIDCENGLFAFSKHTIKDVHPNSVISFHDVVVRSSNIGMSKVGSKMGAGKIYDYLKKFGFGEHSLNLLPGETKGILRPVESWAKVDVATHSFGQGVAVTPLQIVRAMSAIANGGMLPTLHVVNDGKNYPVRRVISEDAAREVREMMYGVVVDEHGTGHNAEISGVRVGGKTGTAQKASPNGRGYLPDSYISSFVGFVDASVLGVDKKLTLIVLMDEPRGKSIYGGVVAAPVFKRIMQRSLHHLTTKEGLQKNFNAAPKEFMANNVQPEISRPEKFNKVARSPGLTKVSYVSYTG